MTAFPWTLQRYLIREITKTFLLAAVALAAVLGLGGSLLHVIKLGEVTPGQLLRLTALVLPLAAALTLPVAALFSATATYGRLSADNEFVACRAGGINLHALFLPTLAVGALSAVVSFLLINFLIPGVIRNLDEFIQSDIVTLIRQRLHHPRGIALDPGGGSGGAYRLRADEVAADPADPGRIALRGITFVQVEGQQWVRFGTAEQVNLVFAQDASPPQVYGALSGLSYYDRNLGHFFEEAQRIIPPNPVDALVFQKIKFLDWTELCRYLSAPAQWPAVRAAIERLRVFEAEQALYGALWDDWQDDKVMTLSDGPVTYTVRAEQAAPPDRDGLDLARVTLHERAPQGRARRAAAPRAVIEVTNCDTVSECTVKIDVFDVRLSNGDTTHQRARETFGPLALPQPILTQVGARTDAQLLGPATPSAQDPLAAERAAVRAEYDATVRRLLGTLHERVSFSVSVFVLVVLGAALGIICRGAHVTTAFGLSFVPMLVVLVGIMAGKQMCYNVRTHLAGVFTMWSGIVAVAALDAWILTRVLRR